jgi:hypothetical protein
MLAPKLFCSWLCFSALSLVSSSALAGESDSQREPPGEQGTPPEAEREPATRSRDGSQNSPDRAPKADDARGYEERPGTEPEDIALFAPRALLAIPRFALRLVFFPIDAGLQFADEHAVIENVEDVLYNDERTAGIVPRLSIDTFFGPTLGGTAFHDDLGGHGEHASASFAFGGRYEQSYEVSLRADRFAGSRLWLESMTRYEVEPGLLFQGIGQPPERASGSSLAPDEAAVETRYRQERMLALLRVGYTVGEPGALTKLGVTGIYNRRRFDEKTRGSGPSTDDVYDTDELVGFDSGVNLFEADLNLVVDTRDVRGATSSGAYVEVFGGVAPKFQNYGFFHHGFEATGYFDLYEKSRVLVLRAIVEGVEGDTDEIPFSELPRLGGANRLRGYPQDRFRDEKVALGTVEYHYPIHQFVAGALYTDVGRVAPSYTELFEREGWKAGVGAGFIVRSRDKVLFTFDVAYGDGVMFHFTTDPLRAFSNRDTEL